MTSDRTDHILDAIDHVIGQHGDAMVVSYGEVDPTDELAIHARAADVRTVEEARAGWHTPAPMPRIDTEAPEGAHVRIVTIVDPPTIDPIMTILRAASPDGARDVTTIRFHVRRDPRAR